MIDLACDQQWRIAEQQRLERRMIADRIAANPALAQIGIAKIDQWLIRGHTARTLLSRARGLLQGALDSPSGLARLLEVLRSDREELQELAETLPLRSILTESEARQVAADVVHSGLASQPRTQALPTRSSFSQAESR